MRRALVAAAIALACGPRPDGPAPSDSRIVRGRAEFLSLWDWERSPWHRLSDPLATPVYVLVADGGRACVVGAPEWVMVIDGESYACRDGWRLPRPR